MKPEKDRLSVARVFGRICTLVGKWKRDDATKDELVAYRMTARDSVLVETWSWPDKNTEAITLYHLDSERLIATHYCPLRNQPRLIFEAADVRRRFLFKFDSATNLPDASLEHCIEFWIEPGDDGSFTRGETYASGGVPVATQARYLRVD